MNGTAALRAFRRPRLWLAIWGLLIASVVAGSLLPARDLPVLPFAGFDKFEHVFGYAMLSAYAVMLFAQRRAQLLAALGLVLLGSVLELAQASWTLTRSGDVADALADLMGVLAGLALGPTPLARALLQLETRLP